MQTSELTRESEAPSKRRVFSGIQPSGDVQLGNYLGAIKGWVERQSEKTNFFCLVDLHAITVYQDPEQLLRQTRSLAAILFAAGLDPERSTVFIQSHVPAHAEACWILNCVTPMGWLERMTQFKDKSANQERVSAGLLDYPVLMAGDILLYDTHEVPVGEDQRQHVELARDIAERFNHLYGETFVVPQAVIAEVGARVMGLNDPTAKMSKSFSHIRGHAIGMLDDPKEIERSFKRAVTDSGKDITFSNDPERAGVNNLLGIYKVITGRNTSEVENDFADARGYGDLKARVAEVVTEELMPIQKRYHEIMDDVSELDRLLARGAEHAASVSTPKMDELKRKVGLTLPRG
ncbi:MAG: tryptophan--tRNA ligase [SAR202 cluster bacterium Casp-Chloro-G4]|nr:tryptophan--tRNA ligase [Chloroflexota bacterium]PKB60995.1 MAG: tryptophan--tRNA ligase [SAR202 cluster bacterium Casp-Chloro-G4]